MADYPIPIAVFPFPPNPYSRIPSSLFPRPPIRFPRRYPRDVNKPQPSIALRLLRTHGYGLLAALLLTLILVYSLEPDPEGRLKLVATGLLISTLVVSLAAAARGRTRLLIGSVLAVAAGVRVVLGPEPETPFELIIDAGGQLYLWYLAACLVADVFSPRIVGITDLFAALCLYIVMAFAYSEIYKTIAFHSPLAFDIPDGASPTDSDIIYFSFVTQTTLGYGDITPRANIARAVAIIQATTGVLYIAVVIAVTVARNTPPTAGHHEADR